MGHHSSPEQVAGSLERLSSESFDGMKSIKVKNLIEFTRSAVTISKAAYRKYLLNFSFSVITVQKSIDLE